MKRIIFYNILIITALLASCKKVELDPVDGDPVFTADMKMDGSAKTWQAGVDDYYMYSSHKKDEYDVHVFSGSFAKKDSIVGEVFTIHIRDFQQLPQGQPEIEAALATGNDFGFADMAGSDTTWTTILDTIGWRVTFDATASQLPPLSVVYDWDFGDGATATDSFEIVEHLYSTIPVAVPVSLNVRATNNSCSGQLTKQVSANSNTSCDLNLQVDYEPSMPDSGMTITANPIGFVQPSIMWDNDSTSNSITLYLQPTGQVNASVTVTDNTGCTAIGGLSTSFNPGTTMPLICLAKFNYSVVPETDTIPVIDHIIPADSLQFSKITIEYTNAVGVQFRSDRQTQAASAFINILDVEDYDVNENGEKTKKLSLEFTCRLWNAQGDFIDVTEGTAVIAVAYP